MIKAPLALSFNQMTVWMHCVRARVPTSFLYLSNRLIDYLPRNIQARRILNIIQILYKYTNIDKYRQIFDRLHTYAKTWKIIKDLSATSLPEIDGGMGAESGGRPPDIRIFQ